MITWKPEKRKIADLVHWEENPRKISDKGAQKLRERIEARGFHDVIKIDTDNTILSGNMRKDVLESMGIEEVNVLVPERELTVEERVLVGLESNMNDGEWDWEEMGDLDKDLLLDAGFSDDELRVNMGLSDADMQEVEESRFDVLTIQPPESPKLKERVAISFKTFEDYERVKKAVSSGKITAEEILKLV